MFFKRLPVDAKIDAPSAPIGGWIGGKFQISNRKVCLATYIWKGLFETKMLIKIVYLKFY